MVISKQMVTFSMVLTLLLGVGAVSTGTLGSLPDANGEMRIGIIGLDISHAPSFTEIINDEDGSYHGDFRVVAAYPEGSQDIESSYSRIPEYTEAVEDMGVEIVGSIEELVQRVDAVMLLTNDGQRRLEQVLPVLDAELPVYIGKPVAASLTDAIKIFDAAEERGVPLFSSSSLRFTENAQAVRNEGSIGRVTGAFAYSPAELEEHHPDLFWYGVHGVEMLFTAMGTGSETVTRNKQNGVDVVVGQWTDGRLGTFHGIRDGAWGYGGTAFGSDGISQLGPFEGNEPLVRSILKFFETGEAPVDRDETLEIFAFMEAADESSRLGGAPVDVQDILEQARAEASENAQ